MPKIIISNNLNAYKILFELERLLRAFISKVLQLNFSDGWAKGIPEKIIRKCETRASREKETYQDIYDDDSNLIIDYADFKDLKEIILKNWPMFDMYFGKREIIEQKLDELEVPRNIIAHNRIISNTELSRIKVYANDLKRCIDREITPITGTVF